MQRTVEHDGYWRRLSEAERAAIARRFWEVGRLTLEPWLAPRIAAAHVHAGAEVVSVDGHVALSDGTTLRPDRIVLATGYRLTFAASRTCRRSARPRSTRTCSRSPAPVSICPGSPRPADFGPFFGFVRGAPAAATLVARSLSKY